MSKRNAGQARGRRLEAKQSCLAEIRATASLRFSWVAYVVPAALIAHAALFWGRGVIDREAMSFVINYLAKRPFLATIFDPKLNDWGWYQARELSFVFDFIDAHVFAALLARHVLIFVPVSGVLGLVALSGIYIWGTRRILRLDHVTTSFSLSLFLSCIVVQASTGILYRSSKILCSVFLITFLFLILGWFRDSNERRPRVAPKLAGIFCLGLLMSLSDRQGFFFLITTLIIGALLLLAGVARGSGRWKDERGIVVVLALVAAAIAATLYNHLLGPQIIHALNGYWPSFDYQHLGHAEIFDPALPAKAWRFFRTQADYFFGNIPFIGVSLAVVAGWWSYRQSNPDGRSFDRLTNGALIATFGSAAALYLLVALMIAHHAPIYTIPDHSFWYYSLPLHVVILFGLGAWLGLPSLKANRQWRPPIWLLLSILIGLNVGFYPRQREAMINSTEWFGEQWQRSQLFVRQFAAMPERPHLVRTETGSLGVTFLMEYAALGDAPGSATAARP